MNITRIGMDTSKSWFHLHGVDRHERVVVRKKLRRAEVLKFFAELAPCRIGMEACAGAHFWARELTKLGHTVQLIAPQHVKPYVKTHKNDARDAEAICEAMSRPTMRFVPIKSEERQDQQALLRIRELLVQQRTAAVNQTRGLLGEYGVVIAQGIDQARRAIPLLLDEQAAHGQGLSQAFRVLLQGLWEDLKGLDERIGALEKQLRQLAAQDERAVELQKVPGVGPLTALSAVVAVGDGSMFKRSREIAPWLGLVPRQHSTGGKERLLGISKHGDVRLRTLLIHGARAVIRHAKNKTDPRSRWINALVARSHPNVAAVALANKNARIIWSLLSSGAEFDLQRYHNSGLRSA